MPLILLKTFINAPQTIVFDLSRSIDLHKDSMSHHKEEVIAGVSTGLLEKGDVVVWKARHFFKNRQLKVRLIELQSPAFFVDEMVEGDFKHMRHEHYFSALKNVTVMTDRFFFRSPFGILGKFADWLFLSNYMQKLLVKRNAEIKRIAESNSWKQYLQYE